MGGVRGLLEQQYGQVSNAEFNKAVCMVQKNMLANNWEGGHLDEYLDMLASSINVIRGYHK